MKKTIFYLLVPPKHLSSWSGSSGSEKENRVWACDLQKALSYFVSGYSETDLLVLRDTRMILENKRERRKRLLESAREDTNKSFYRRVHPLSTLKSQIYFRIYIYIYISEYMYILYPFQRDSRDKLYPLCLRSPYVTFENIKYL